MTKNRPGLAIACGLLLPALLAATACSDRKPPEKPQGVEEAPVTSPPETPPTAPAAPLVRAEPSRKPPPAVAPSKDAQMQEDAEASGMTSRMPAVVDTTDRSEPGNSN
jgi:hypothetical protein